MIPHIIHYCWFGGNPLPELAGRCIASWKEHMPAWKIMRWDESNFDVSSAPLYVRQAYAARKFAFVSDYVRLWALEQYGGVYLDTDVKVLRSYEPLLGDTAFIGLEESKRHLPGTCTMGCVSHCQWVRDMLALYDDAVFVHQDGSYDLMTNVDRLGVRMEQEGLNRRVGRNEPWHGVQYIAHWGLRVYTHDYFSPITSTRVMRMTENTYSIHYFAASWVEKTRGQLVKEWIITHLLGRKLTDKLVQMKRRLRRK